MCGISGYIGLKNNGITSVLTGLQRLEYRGYDSAGISFYANKKFYTFKTINNISGLETLIKKDCKKITSNLAIGHTRWATHGAKSIINAHPHEVNDFIVVHNGIIENYLSLKSFLQTQGYQFKSTTDSEIACACVDYYYHQYQDINKTIAKVIEIFEGNYALVVIHKDNPNQLIAFCNNAPITIGIKENECFIASDEAAFLNYTNKFIRLDNKQMCIANNTNNILSVQYFQKIDNKLQFNVINKEILTSKKDPNAYDKDGYEHYMLKEISEQPAIINKTIKQYQDNFLFDLHKYQCINIIACGSSMYVGEIAKFFLMRLNKKVNVYCASEFRYMNPILNQDDLCIFISQSGETADTLAALQLANHHNVDTLAIVNVVDSSIMLHAKYSILTLAAAEISVATTKAFSAQLSVLLLIYLQNAVKQTLIDNQTYNTILTNLSTLNNIVKQIINSETIKTLALQFKNTTNAFFLGRGIDYALSLEGSLKLKEISYIHAEAYPSGELKHGPITLIDEKTPSFIVMTDKNLVNKTISNIEEVKARHGDIYLIGPNELIPDNFKNNQVFAYNSIDQYSDIFINLVILQVIAYYIAKNRGCEIDRPKNLAKSVTVE